MVSVIIPVYNGEKTIESCIESALSLSFEDIEVIAVDDGSTDTSLQILRDYAQKDKRLRVLAQKNSGVSSARNLALKHAKGEYVVFLDVDDMLDKNCIEHLIGCILDGVDMVIGSYTQFRSKSGMSFIKRDNTCLTLSEIKDDMHSYDPLFDTPWAKLYKTDIINKNNLSFDTALALAEDHKFNLQYLKHCRKIAVSDKNVYYYRLGGMASANKFYENKIELNLSLLYSYADFFGSIDNIPKDFLYKKTKDQFFGCVRHFYLFCSKADAKRFVVKAFAAFAPFFEADRLKSGYTQKERLCIESSDAKGIIRCVVSKKRMKLMFKRILIKFKKLKR